jgi:cobalt-zinc-cadmium efflux system outer membrane protein
MGRDAGDFDLAAGDLGMLAPLPDLADLERQLETSPLMVQYVAENERRRRVVNLEKARGLPDLDIGIGARYLRESQDTALVVGISLPLPLFDRNQGAIAAARSRQAQARAEQRSALLRTKIALNEAWQEMNVARAEAQVLAEEMIPASRQVLESAEYGYRAGKFGILEVLDAQRHLVDSQERHLLALVALYRAATDIQRLLGSALPPIDHPATLSSTIRSNAP